MRFFEIHDIPRADSQKFSEEGFQISMTPYPCVALGPDHEWGHTVLPLGKSIHRHLAHPEDREVPFRLLFGNLKESNSGLCLVAQTEEAASRDKRALILIDCCHEAGHINGALIRTAHGCSEPEELSHVQHEGYKRNIYIFRPGSGLFIDLPAAPDKFVIEWDGQRLLEAVCRRRRRQHRSELRT